MRVESVKTGYGLIWGWLIRGRCAVTGNPRLHIIVKRGRDAMPRWIWVDALTSVLVPVKSIYRRDAMPQWMWVDALTSLLVPVKGIYHLILHNRIGNVQKASRACIIDPLIILTTII